MIISSQADGWWNTFTLLGEIKLEMPSISLEGPVSALAADLDTVEVLEQSVISWLNQISAAVESQLKKTPQVPWAVLPTPRCGSRSPPRGGASSRHPAVCTPWGRACFHTAS